MREGYHNCECVLCGAEAHSKCPHCRTIFPANKFEAMLSYGFMREIETDERGISWLKVEFFVGNSEEKHDLTKALTELYNTLKGMEDPESHWPSIAHYACDHEFRFKPGCEASIGCGHSYQSYSKGGD